jgi:hypothetical protein
MSQRDRQQTVLELLRNFRGLASLKTLFWSELNYERVNQPLSRRDWTETAAKTLEEVYPMTGAQLREVADQYGRE